MKLRPRNKLPVNASSTVPATVPVLPPDTTRPQTPPISELSNAGSTMVREERLSDSSSSVVDDSDMEERMESMPPPTNGRNLKITVPPAAAPLTKNNLKKLSEGISSAVEIGSEGFFSSPMPSPHTRLVQARNFLRAENRNTCLGFAIMLEQIADFLHEIPEDVRGVHDSIYREVKDLLRTHRGYVRAGEQVPSPPRPKRPVTSKNWASRPPKYDGDKDNDKDKDPNDHAEGPLEWTNKINTLIDIIRRDPSAHRPSVVLSHLRDLARPLNKGRLPSADEARRLITERIDKEGGRGGNNKAPDKEMKEEDDDDHDDGAGHHGGSDGKIGSLSGVKRMQLGRGSMMPKEVREWDWERDRRVVLNDYDDQDDEDEVNEDEEEGEGPEAQLLLAETPFLQMLMAGQIRGDLQSGEFVVCFFFFFLFLIVECGVSGDDGWE